MEHCDWWQVHQTVLVLVVILTRELGDKLIYINQQYTKKEWMDITKSSNYVYYMGLI